MQAARKLQPLSQSPALNRPNSGYSRFQHTVTRAWTHSKHETGAAQVSQQKKGLGVLYRSAVRLLHTVPHLDSSHPLRLYVLAATCRCMTSVRVLECLCKQLNFA